MKKSLVIFLSLFYISGTIYAEDQLDAIINGKKVESTNAVVTVAKNKNNLVNIKENVLAKKSSNKVSRTNLISSNPIKVIHVERIKNRANLNNKTLLVTNSTNNQEVVANKFKNLDAIDADSNDINKLNRRLQVEKVEAEIKKLKNGGVVNNEKNANNENAQTIVTGVAINSEGRKIAWLQFADGGSLMVNIGSSVGKYHVTDINMTGVTISEEIGHKKHKHLKTVFLKRSYATNISRHHGSNSSHKSMFFTPSPVITGANNTDSDVPPIIRPFSQ
jgi:hypothetical protein